MKKTKSAFIWIVDILREHNISFLISGGLAAKIYGSKRALADIDIEVNDKDITFLREKVKKYIIYGPKKYKDSEFDLLLMTLKYKGQEIDICGKDSLKLYNKQKKAWRREKRNLNDFTLKKIYGKLVPVIPLSSLISYKKKISRAVDLKDVKNLIKKQTKKNKETKK